MSSALASAAFTVRAAPVRATARNTARASVVAKPPAGLRATLPVRLNKTAGVSVSRRAVVTKAVDGATRDVSVKTNTDNLIIDPVVGAKRFSNYFWAGVVSIGATGFLITGASSYFEHNLLFFLDASEIKFFPQGLVMSFYGVAGSLLATYLWLTINWDVGAGYNEFNKDEGIMRIFRYGFPGKNRRINLVSNLSDVQAVRVEIRDGVNPQRVVYVRCKGKSDIPLTRIGQPMTLAETEQKAADLAKFLGVPIEGL